MDSQAATSLQNLKVKESPAKKLDFSVENKENLSADAPLLTVAQFNALKTPVTELVKTSPEPPKVAPGIKADETDEPILQENPHRFVLFPIKYAILHSRVTRKVDTQQD